MRRDGHTAAQQDSRPTRSGAFPWEQRSSLDGKAREPTVVSNPLDVGAACLNQALEVLGSSGVHLDRNVHVGGGALTTETAKARRLVTTCTGATTR